ncbi:MAG: hypothetical protein IPL08_15060 [Saprospiraceae bacterium]|nr:hypothetical protein [Saprospiraceae bacterium]
MIYEKRKCNRPDSDQSTGGMIEFEQTGKYLIICTFILLITDTAGSKPALLIIEGTLKMVSKPVYEYKLSDSHCIIRAILDDTTIPLVYCGYRPCIAGLKSFSSKSLSIFVFKFFNIAVK